MLGKALIWKGIKDEFGGRALDEDEDAVLIINALDDVEDAVLIIRLWDVAPSPSGVGI